MSFAASECTVADLDFHGFLAKFFLVALDVPAPLMDVLVLTHPYLLGNLRG